MTARKISLLILPLALIFAGCDEVANSPAEQKRLSPEVMGLEDNIEGAENETRVVAFVFEQPVTIKEATKATSQHQLDVLSAKFYIDGINGTAGNAKAQSPQETFTNLSLFLEREIEVILQEDRGNIAPTILRLTREEFEASRRWQMKATALLDRARQREAMGKVLQNKQAAIHTVTLQGSVRDLQGFAEEFKLEGVANLEFGSSLMTPKPASIQLQENSAFTQQALLSPTKLYERAIDLIREIGIEVSDRTNLVIDDSFEVAPTYRDQSFPNWGTVEYWSPERMSGGKVVYDAVVLNFEWYRPGDWNFPYSGFEMDFNVYTKYLYSGCTATTSLPNGYDDCPTAGVSENNNSYIGFGFGTFVAKNIRDHYQYFGDIVIYTNGYYRSGKTFDWNVSGQENARRAGCSGVYNIWCRQAKDSKSLATSPDFRTGSRGTSSWR